jgi:hypothetical protein
VTEICHVELPAHALLAVKVRLKSVSNKGHFTLGTERVFRSHLSSHCSGVSEICYMAPPGHSLRVMQVRLTSVSNEGHFTVLADEFFSVVSPIAFQKGY